jgi:hypothetical protein
MVDVLHKRCEEQGCESQSRTFNIEGSKKGLYCGTHKKENMVDVIHKRCIGQNGSCTTGASNKQYEGYCLFCFMNTFPNKPVARNYKTKEYAVVSHIQSHFPFFDWKHDRKIEDGCSLKRPDLFLDMGGQIIIIEIDEDSHRTYDCSCENKRIMTLSQDVNFRSIVFIRFNPDKYMDIHGVLHPSCWKRDKNGIVVISKKQSKEWEHRLDMLVQTIYYWTKHETNRMIETIELFMG